MVMKMDHIFLRQEKKHKVNISKFGFQMLFLATFFPTWEGGVGAYDFVGVSV